MQERYLGDIHDFKKFIFLKFLSLELNIKIGLNWFLVDPIDIGEKEIKKNDGEKREYLLNQNYRVIDEKIFEEFKNLKEKKNRKIFNFTKKTHLKNYINFYNEKIDYHNREAWFDNSIKFFENQKVIFLDPDNGLMKKKKTPKISMKYVFIQEIKKYIFNNKTVIFSQFQSFNKSNLSYLDEMKNFLKINDIKLIMPIVRNRTSPNTFFITLTNNRVLQKRLVKVFEKFILTEKHSTELITI
mgnify:CR=1 FL=1|jgi:hypothetical protein